MSLFAKEKINKGRQLEIDALKAICIVCMIFIHVMEDCVGSGAMESTQVSQAMDKIGVVVGAAAFMFCMGIGMRYARNQSAKAYVIRGIAIITVGQMLNLLRNVLFNLTAYWITNEQWFLANSFLVIQADILSFAGLAFLLIALLRKLNLSDGAILGIGIAMNLTGWAAHYLMPLPDSYLANQIIGYFFITKAESYFPLMSYFVFVAAGFLAGGKYPYIKDKDKFSTLVLKICVPICAVYYFFRIPLETPFLPEYDSDLNYSMYPGPDAIASILAACLLLALFYKIIHRAGDKIPRFVAHLSENINSYYCISYMFILPFQTLIIALTGRLLDAVVPDGGMLMLVGLALTLSIIVACAGIIEINKRYIHFSVVALGSSKAGRIVLLGVWVLTVVIVIYDYPRIVEFANIWDDYLLPGVD